MYNDYSSSPTLTNVTFSGNSANLRRRDVQLVQQQSADPQHDFLGQYGCHAERRFTTTAAALPVVSDSVVQGGYRRRHEHHHH